MVQRDDPGGAADYNAAGGSQDQNGTNTTDTITDIYDELGNLSWRRDARGYISYHAYDLPTGAVIQSIEDVDGAKLTLPSGWSTPAGGGLHLITDYEIDALGRTTQSLGPVHDVLGQSVRTASWMVYRDLEDETYSGQGYALGNRTRVRVHASEPGLDPPNEPRWARFAEHHRGAGLRARRRL